MPFDDSSDIVDAAHGHIVKRDDCHHQQKSSKRVLQEDFVLLIKN